MVSQTERKSSMKSKALTYLLYCCSYVLDGAKQPPKDCKIHYQQAQIDGIDRHSDYWEIKTNAKTYFLDDTTTDKDLDELKAIFEPHFGTDWLDRVLRESAEQEERLSKLWN